MYFQPAHFPFGPQKDAFYRGQFVIWPRVLIIMNILISPLGSVHYHTQTLLFNFLAVNTTQYGLTMSNSLSLFRNTFT